MNEMDRKGEQEGEGGEGGEGGGGGGESRWQEASTIFTPLGVGNTASSRKRWLDRASQIPDCGNQ